MSADPPETFVQRVACPQCGRMMKSARPLRVGRQIACLFCKRPFRVEAGAAPPKTDKEPAATRPGNASAGREPPHSGTPLPLPLPVQSAPPQAPGYTILGELGRGGMGVVYKARHEQLKRVVALKMLSGGSDAGLPDRARFTAEAEAVARLRHPHIVQIYEIGEFDQKPYLALEYVGGGTLKDRINGGPQPGRASAQLVETLARAVQHAHERGVLHRDLKPANVLLDAPAAAPADGGDAEDASRLYGAPKVTDFGLAKRIDFDSGVTRHGEIIGTPMYMAPEQARGRHELVGPATDVYALGAILYELLTGRPPFQSEVMGELFDQIVNQPPIPLRRVNPKTPRELETICLKCLEKSPSQRYLSALALADDLARFLRGEPILAQSARRSPRQASRVRTALLILAVALPVSAAWYAYSLYASGLAADAVRREDDAERRKQMDDSAMDEARDEAKAVRNMLLTYGRWVGRPVRDVSEPPQELDGQTGWAFRLKIPNATGNGQQRVAIPVPFTFADKFHEAFKWEPQSRLSWLIYSEYPFPDSNHPPPDRWRKEVWEEVCDSTKDAGDQPRHTTDEVPGTKQRRLRYAEVLRMADEPKACCTCHNDLGDHIPEWKGKQWKPGDVRGIIEVDRVLDP